MKKLAVLFSVLAVFFALKAEAQIRQYQYDSIIVNIAVNKDSTFDVEERQVFNYTGQYNKGWRSIPFKDISTISDIWVIDGETNKTFVYSSKILEKTDPQSWGKFTYYKENGRQNI